MKIVFYKYQGTGNDFIIIDNRLKTFPKQNSKLIKKLCHRNFGIGADGLILLENDSTADFKMVYYNADGNESTMCGNGGLCIVAFANKLELINDKATFVAVDDIHRAEFNNDVVFLQMIDVSSIKVYENHSFINTGSPHHVELVENIDEYDVFTQGKNIRNSLYGKEGSNINFVEQTDISSFRLRTYERGVENETLACGTGATATAIVMHALKKTQSSYLYLQTEGGTLSVTFDYVNDSYTNVHLIGSAELVFNGTIEI